MKTHVALITGAARRIGAAIARDLSSKKWRVIVHYHQSEAEALSLSDEIRNRGGLCETIRADLRDRDDIENLVPRCVERFGTIDCLINNAAFFSYDNIETLEWDLWNRHIATNLTAPLFLSREFSKQLPSDENGVIINMLDQKTTNLNPDFLSYTASKIGLRGLTRTLAMALAPRIRVCGISPGVTLISGRQTQQSFEKSVKATPLGRSSTLEEIANCVSFILSTPSMSGEVVTIDGGESLTGRRRDVAFDLK